MTPFDTMMREEARLRTLQALAEQPDGTLSDAVIGCALRTFGIGRGEAFVRAELAWLADAGAVRTRDAGDLVLATLTRRGQEHVDRAAYLPGVKRPALER